MGFTIQIIVKKKETARLSTYSDNKETLQMYWTQTIRMKAL